MTGPPSRPGTTVFWATIGAFLLVDGVLVLGPRLPWFPMARLAPALSYLLLGAFALAFAVVSTVVLVAIRDRRVPPLADGLRALAALVLVAAHTALLWIAQRGR